MMTMILLLTGCSNNKDKVVIYTSMEEERNQVLKEMIKKEFPDTNVVVQYMATGNSAAKIKNEGSKVEAVWQCRDSKCFKSRGNTDKRKIGADWRVALTWKKALRLVRYWHL